MNLNLNINTINETARFLCRNRMTGLSWDGAGFNADLRSPKARPVYVTDTQRLALEYTYDNVVSIPCQHAM